MAGIDEWLRRPPWYAERVCTDIDLMFDPVRTARAVAVCRPCPVRRECLAGALTRREPDGVWGGFTTDERMALVKATEADIPILLRHIATRQSSRESAS